MWAAAALQNLAASYCDTKNDGRCYWGWTGDDSDVVVRTESLPIISDGANARKAMLEIGGLVESLVALACTGPVRGRPSDRNIFPGENAILGRDDNNPHLLAWAATGALKNLALEPTSKLLLEPALKCMCALKRSPDWLERAKSKDMMGFMRRGGHPCWFGKRGFCIDQNFLDEEGYHCGDYDSATRQECQAQDVATEILARSACCGCGGGMVYQDTEENY